MIGYIQLVEWLAGGILIALCTVWLAREAGMNRRRWALVVVWSALWLAVVTVMIVALIRAEDALSSVAPEDKIDELSRWVTAFEVSQTVSRIVVGVGCLVCFGIWFRDGRRSDESVDRVEIVD